MNILLLQVVADRGSHETKNWLNVIISLYYI